MTLKVYTYKSVDSLKYDILHTSKDLLLIDCEKLEFKDFKQYHFKNLFNNSDRVCLYNIDYKQELLLEFIESIEVDVVWCFKSLPKNRKLYKKLVKLTDIIVSTDLSKTKDKNSFVKKLCKEYNIPQKYIEDITIGSSESKYNVENEVIKLSIACKVCPELAHLVIGNYTSDSDLFSLCNNIISDSEKAIIYSSKVIMNNTPVNYIYAMLSKRMFYYLYLAQRDEVNAKRFWNSSPYFIKKDIQVARELGMNKILVIIKHLTSFNSTTFSNLSDPAVLLTSLIVTIIDLKDIRQY